MARFGRRPPPPPAAPSGERTGAERTILNLALEMAPDGHRTATRDSVLSELGYDSLALAELAAAIEERFGVRLADCDVTRLRTVGEVAAAVERKASRKPTVPTGIGRGQVTGKWVVGWALRWYCRLRVLGAEHVPLAGPVILAANHRSMLDVPLTVIACPRPMVFMAKQELFGDPFRRWLWDWLGGFPVRRDISDIRALEVALAILKGRHCLGLYPEGTRSRTGEMLPFLKGAAWLALRTGAPIVPCGIRGTETRKGWRKLLRKRVRIAFGPAIEVQPESAVRARRDKSAEITDRLLGEVARLSA